MPVRGACRHSGVTSDGFLYHSTEYKLMREGIGDLHCMTEDYIVEDLMLEWNGQGRYDPPKVKLAEDTVQQ